MHKILIKLIELSEISNLSYSNLKSESKEIKLEITLKFDSKYNYYKALSEISNEMKEEWVCPAGIIIH